MTHSIDLQGHRGARGRFPENTLEGFAATLAIGVDTLELDVAMTADDVVVVTHDPTLNPAITRTADGAWLAQRGPAIRSLRAAELARYDVGRIRPGSAYAAQFPDQTPHDGARIPTLAEVLRIDQAVKFNIELKTFPAVADGAVDGARLADAVVAVADACGACRADHRAIVRLARAAPSAPHPAGNPCRMADPVGDRRRGPRVVGWAGAGRLRRLGAARRGGGGWTGLGARPP